jgi:hypothetical protein
MSIILDNPTRIAIVVQQEANTATTIDVSPSTQALITQNSFCIVNSNTKVFFPPSDSVFINFHLDDLLEIKMEGEFDWFINTTSGDLNHDGTVSIADFIELASNFGQPASWDKGDLNHDGIVSIADFIGLAANFGQTTAPFVCGEPEFTVLTVPDPSALVALSLLLVKRRRR